MQRQQFFVGLIGVVLVSIVTRHFLYTMHTTSRTQMPFIATSPPPLGMVLVAGGTYHLGTNDADADDEVRPERLREMAPFYIDRTEVTNAQFKVFRADHPYPKGEENLPVTHVTYAEAEAYAAWAGKQLPTGDEWEAAARGQNGSRYPWGDTWDKSRVAVRRNGKVNRVQPVDSVPSVTSPCGAVDMGGNAWEWVQGFYNGNTEQRILRGGAVGYGERACRTYNQAVEGACVT
jgi:formylglycine-generating enzyme required for sulfatase activity